MDGPHANGEAEVFYVTDHESPKALTIIRAPSVSPSFVVVKRRLLLFSLVSVLSPTARAAVAAKAFEVRT